jgi:hypothetical protein
MPSTVDIDRRLAEALRAVIVLAQHSEPDWLPPSVVIERRKTLLAARIALMEYEEAMPAPSHLIPRFEPVLPVAA